VSRTSHAASICRIAVKFGKIDSLDLSELFRTFAIYICESFAICKERKWWTDRRITSTRKVRISLAGGNIGPYATNLINLRESWLSPAQPRLRLFINGLHQRS
jgi:hypothetical protein